MNLYAWTDTAHTFGLFLLETTLRATLLLLAVLLADRFCSRRRAAWRHLLWAMGVVGLLLIPLASALLPALRIPASRVPVVEAVVYLSQPTPELEESFQWTPAPSLNRPPAVTPHPDLAPSLPALSRTQLWTNIAVAVYLAGLLVFLGRLVAGLIYISILRHRAQDLDDRHLLSRLQALRSRLGLWRPIKLAASDRVSSPTQIGFLFPVIIIPTSMFRRQDSRVVETMVAHECAHVYCWDYLLNLISAMVRALYWLNPLSWLAGRCLRQTSEQACDDWTVALMGDHLAYTRTLLEVTAGLQQSRIVALGASMAGITSITRRIDRIMALGGHVTPRIGRLLGATMVLAVLSSALALGSSVLHTGDAPEEYYLEWNEQPDWSSMNLEERREAARKMRDRALQYYRKDSDRAIELRWEAIQTHPGVYDAYRKRFRQSVVRTGI